MGITVHDSEFSEKRAVVFRKKLLSWYDANRRAIAWRAPSGVTPDPYHVWLSEIMCQQTTVAAVIPYFLKFVKKWPTIDHLAKAKQEDVMREWAGLGYYARARNLHACAQIVSKELKGRFPDNQEDLKKLPGIGDYTAAAILAIAFNKPATVVDGNVERVVARYFAIEEPLPGVKPELKKLAGIFFENFKERPGDLAQAFMDLGAGVCIPAAPRCSLCPISKECQGRIKGIAAELPRKISKARPQRFGHVYWITDAQGRVLIHRRPQKGLLGGMAGLPTSAWVENRKLITAPDELSKTLSKALKSHKASVFHTFTHFDLELGLHVARVSSLRAKDYYWIKSGEVEGVGLPTVFRKALKIFQKNPTSL